MTCDRDHALFVAYGESGPCPDCASEAASIADVRRLYADAAEPMTPLERARLLRAAPAFPGPALFIAAAAALMLALLPFLYVVPQRPAPHAPLPAPIDADLSSLASRVKSFQKQDSSLDRDIESLRNRIRWTVASIPEGDL